MTEYVFLTNYSGNWAFDGKSGTSFYIVAVKDGNCKPMVFKCDKSTFDASVKFKSYDRINIVFNEKQVVCGINAVS